MIVANLATFPPRREQLLRCVADVAAQFDRLNVVLNEYDAPVPELEQFANVNQMIPQEDLKDVGKFLPDVAGADWVFLLDDDLLYPPDYVARSIASMTPLGARRLGGYHGSVYGRPVFSLKPRRFLRWLRYSPSRIADHRRIINFRHPLDKPIVVHQIGSGTAVLRPSEMPPFDYMRDSQQFTDVRLAKWCAEHGITPVLLPREERWIGQQDIEQSIFDDFTQTNPKHVHREIVQYAVADPTVGKPLTAGAT